jgi:hydroxymethylpyrimidine/phosphomethylpyrimidine kinase
VPPEIILAQVRAVIEDIGVDAVKVGMLGTVQGTLAVAGALDELPADTPVVVDPVMVAESGARLLHLDAQRALIDEILPRATVLTPNLPEARVLAGRAAEPSGDAGKPQWTSRAAGGRAESSTELAESEGLFAREDAEAEELIGAVLALGPHSVVLTGGHRTDAVDLFLDSAGERLIVRIPGERHPDGAAHGSGCTHSSVLAAQLALGRAPLQAARIARVITGAAVEHGLRGLGAGAGPVDVLDLAQMRAR